MTSALYNCYYLSELQNRFGVQGDVLEKLRKIKEIADNHDVLMEDILQAGSMASMMNLLKQTENDVDFVKLIDESCKEYLQKKAKTKKNFDMLVVGAGL